MSPRDACAADPERSLTVKQAAERIDATVTPVSASERVGLKSALGRVVAADIQAPAALPAYRNAAVDGYAVNSVDLLGRIPAVLQVAGTSWAGRPFTGPLPSGCCIRIFTGAMVPHDADAVIMQERVRRIGEAVIVTEPIPVERFIRLPGEDVRLGETVLHAGRKLSPADIMLLAALGFCEIPVRCRPRIAFFSTGDELRPTTATLGAGEIHDSNRYLLHGLLEGEPVRLYDLGVVADDRSALRAMLLDASASHEAVITTGSASVGEADFMHDILNEIGRVEIWKVAIKPGKPFIFGKIGDCLLFGLPGNPVSVFATFRQLVQPALQRLIGAAPKTPIRLRARCLSTLRKAPGRLEYQRGLLQQDAPGAFSVSSSGRQGSHGVGTLSKSNCFIILPAECTGIEPGEMVEVEPFDASL